MKLDAATAHTEGRTAHPGSSADHVIVENTDELRRLRQGGFKRSASLVYTCVPPWRFESVTETREETRRRMGWPEEKVVFLMPARMTSRKNHQLVFNVMQRPDIRDLPAIFCFPGDGPLIERHRKTVRRMGLQERASLPGYLPNMGALYKAADVFLLSTHFESLPVSIREAMMVKLPVIATNVNGIPEAVKDGQTGVLVRKDNADDLAQAISALAGNIELRRQYGQAGHAFLLERFNADHWARNTVEVYQDVRKRMGLE